MTDDTQGARGDLVAVLTACAVLLAGLLVTAVGAWRLGLMICGGAVLLAALCRLLLPVRLAGPLQVRSRAMDTAVLLLSGTGIVVLAVVIPPPGPGF
ncbi:DUF3017 domain-containing protein [Naumannella halotolerans]|uniref:DUF3017 domain-containing protein n=1 Tax=Naumannella halotolerans TaxID=993414 RepID=UPI001414E3F2|nr:DUF3017 domain-containing protein [Naumannella halotolerans]